MVRFRVLLIQIAMVISVLPVSSQTGDRRRPNAPKKLNYSVFQHSSTSHRIQCSSCHKFPSSNWNVVRDASTAFPDITENPRHDSCLKCHQQQFFRGSKPQICSVCHSATTPKNPPRHLYPNPRENYDQTPRGRVARSDFAVGFPHETHLAMLAYGPQKNGFFTRTAFSPAGRSRADETCTMCHQTIDPQGKSNEEFVTKPPASNGDGYWLKKGTFKSAPIGHSTCFTCHSVESGMLPAPSDCAACHKLKIPQKTGDFDADLAAKAGVTDRIRLEAWSSRASAGTFRHEWFSHEELSCNTCHKLGDMNTADPATTRVSVSACATCHATPTSDDGGALNYEMDQRKADPKFACVKCHLAFGKLAVPNSHVDAIAAAAGK